MIEHLIHEDWLLVFPVVAFLVAGLILAAGSLAGAMRTARVADDVERPPSNPE